MIEEINAEILKVCNDLIEEAQIISKLAPVSHLSTSKIQFQGGILGSIREYRESKRLEKLINVPICNGWTFYTYTYHLIHTAQELVKKQLEIQNATTVDDECYFGNVKLVVLSIETAHKAWFEYSPDMAWGINDKNDVVLAVSVNTNINNELRKLDLPEELSYLKKETSNNGDCLGVLLLFLIGNICTLFI